jgi:hypothetical protein
MKYAATRPFADPENEARKPALEDQSPITQRERQFRQYLRDAEWRRATMLPDSPKIDVVTAWKRLNRTQRQRRRIPHHAEGLGSKNSAGKDIVWGRRRPG